MQAKDVTCQRETSPSAGALENLSIRQGVNRCLDGTRDRVGNNCENWRREHGVAGHGVGVGPDGPMC